MLTLDPKRTALVLIDVQKGTLGMKLAPHGAPEIVATSVRLAQHCQEAGATVVLVNVRFSDGFADRPGGATDTPMMLPPGGLPAGWSDFAPELAAVQPHIAITHSGPTSSTWQSSGHLQAMLHIASSPGQLQGKAVASSPWCSPLGAVSLQPRYAARVNSHGLERSPGALLFRQ